MQSCKRCTVCSSTLTLTRIGSYGVCLDTTLKCQHVCWEILVVVIPLFIYLWLSAIISEFSARDHLLGALLEYCSALLFRAPHSRIANHPLAHVAQCNSVAHWCDVSVCSIMELCGTLEEEDISNNTCQSDTFSFGFGLFMGFIDNKKNICINFASIIVCNKDVKVPWGFDSLWVALSTHQVQQQTPISTTIYTGKKWQILT